MIKTRFVAAGIVAAVAGSLVTATASQAATVTPPASCPLVFTRAVDVASAYELRTALSAAQPGDEIRLAPGSYVGNFTIGHGGTATAPVVVCGDSDAILDGGVTATGYTLHVWNAPYSVVQGFTVEHGQKAVMIDNSPDVTVDNLTVQSTGYEGVVFRHGSSYGVIRNSTITNTGLDAPQYGEGVYVGSADNNWVGGVPDKTDGVQVLDNRIGPGVAAEEVDVKEGTTGGVVEGNVFDGSGMVAVTAGAQSWVDVKGNNWLVIGNTGRHTIRHGLSDSLALPGWGNDNVVAANVEYVYAKGYGVKVVTGVKGVKVTTSNVVFGAYYGVSNIKLVKA